MGRAKQKGSKSEFDQMMDEIAPETEEEEEVEAPKEEFHQEAVQAPLETPQTDKKDEWVLSEEDAEAALQSEQEATRKNAEAKEAKAEEAADTAPVEPVASPSPDPVPTVEQLERVNQGLQNEIRKLREKSNAHRQAQQAQMQPPPPVQQPVQQAPVAEEGPDLEDLIVYKDGAAGIDRGKLRQIIAQETAPDPASLIEAQNQEFRNSFAASATTPEARQTHIQALARTEQAFEHLQLSLRVKAQEYGFPLEQARYDQVVGFLNQSGVMSEVGTQYPDVAPDFPAILAASSMGSQEMMSAALTSYVARNAQAPATPANPIPATEAPTPIKPLPVQRAPSLADVGSTPESPGTDEQSRFSQLEKDFNSSPDDFPTKDYQEMIRLEEKFGLA